MLMTETSSALVAMLPHDQCRWRQLLWGRCKEASCGGLAKTTTAAFSVHLDTMDPLVDHLPAIAEQSTPSSSQCLRSVEPGASHRCGCDVDDG